MMGPVAVLTVALATFAALVVIGVLRIRSGGRKSVALSTCLFAAAVLELVLTAALYKPPMPEIYPPNGMMSTPEEGVSIKAEFGEEVYYTFSPRDDLSQGHGMRYDGTPIEVNRSGYIGARARFLFWESPLAHVDITTFEDSQKKYGEQDGFAGEVVEMESPLASLWYADSLVSDERSPSYESLPDGLLSGWGDNGGGRRSHTLDEVNHGQLGDQVVFNTISDSVTGDEKNFVAAKVVNASEDQHWSANIVDVKPGERYKVRIYGHNNSPLGDGACARDVEAAFAVPEQAGRSVAVHGLIRSSNASPSEYWDGVVFTSDTPFRLAYVPGSAILNNNGIGAGDGCPLPDSIAESWVTLGYNQLDGVIPGCYQYAFVAVIEVDVLAADVTSGARHPM